MINAVSSSHGPKKSMDPRNMATGMEMYGDGVRTGRRVPHVGALRRRARGLGGRVRRVVRRRLHLKARTGGENWFSPRVRAAAPHAVGKLLRSAAQRNHSLHLQDLHDSFMSVGSCCSFVASCGNFLSCMVDALAHRSHTWERAVFPSWCRVLRFFFPRGCRARRSCVSAAGRGSLG